MMHIIKGMVHADFSLNLLVKDETGLDKGRTHITEWAVKTSSTRTH